MKKLPKLIVILGPTASGKTNLAVKLAKKFNGEIVNADSRNIYKHMYIGTASPFTEARKRGSTEARCKISNFQFPISNKTPTINDQNKKARKQKIKTEQDVILSGSKDLFINGIRHHLFHFVEPWKVYTVGDYKKDAIKVINDVIKRGKTPIMVGGTGLYVWAVVDNLEIPEVPPNRRLRKQLMTPSFVLRLRQKLGVDIRARKKLSEYALWDILLKLDPEAASFVQKDNPRRIIRALEVMLTVNKKLNFDALRSAAKEGSSASIIKFSQLRRKGQPLYDILQIGIKTPREKLYKLINARVKKQMSQGLVNETKIVWQKIVQKLAKNTSSIKCRSALYRTSNKIGRDFSQYAKCVKVWQLPSMTALGYRQIGTYLRGEVDLPEATRILARDTRRYAARQIRWFKRDRRIKWLNNRQESAKKIDKFLHHQKKRLRLRQPRCSSRDAA